MAKDPLRFVKALSTNETLKMILIELREKGVEVNMCPACGELKIQLRNSMTRIQEHTCKT